MALVTRCKIGCAASDYRDNRIGPMGDAMIFLRFPDEQTFLALVPTDDEGNITLPNLDVVGIIYEGGEYDDEGNVITPPTPKPGYHVNVVGDVPEGWEPYEIPRPTNPHRIFSGH